MQRPLHVAPRPLAGHARQHLLRQSAWWIPPPRPRCTLVPSQGQGFRSGQAGGTSSRARRCGRRSAARGLHGGRAYRRRHRHRDITNPSALKYTRAQSPCRCGRWAIGSARTARRPAAMSLPQLARHDARACAQGCSCSFFGMSESWHILAFVWLCPCVVSNIRAWLVLSKYGDSFEVVGR